MGPRPDPKVEGIDALADWAGCRGNRYRLEGIHCSESVLRANRREAPVGSSRHLFDLFLDCVA